jgi:bifunctional DNA-binding transcriptional regulator/antitoxin component of YhaV-PrlF toxin-antitoxin module
MKKQEGNFLGIKNVGKMNTARFIILPKWWLGVKGITIGDPVDVYLTPSGGLLIKPSNSKECGH